MSEDEARQFKETQDKLSNLVWWASQEQLLKMGETSDKNPSGYIHLINKQSTIVCNAQPVVSMAPSTVAGNIQVGALSFGKDPEMRLVTTRARRASCPRCIYTFNEDMKHSRGELAMAGKELCKVLGILGGFGGIVALVVLGVIWLT